MKWDVAKSACQLTPLFPKLSNRVFWIAQTQGREENQSQQAQNELIFIAMNEFGCQNSFMEQKSIFSCSLDPSFSNTLISSLKFHSTLLNFILVFIFY